MYPQVHSGGSSSRCLTENPIAVSIYSSHLNFRRCYRLTRHPHVPSSALRWLVVAVPSRKSHCCEYRPLLKRGNLVNFFVERPGSGPHLPARKLRSSPVVRRELDQIPEFQRGLI